MNSIINITSLKRASIKSVAIFFVLIASLTTVSAQQELSQKLPQEHFSMKLPLQEFSSQELSLEQCREMALENNIENTIAKEQINAAAYKVAEYKTNYLPKVSATGLYLYSNATLAKTIEGGMLPTFVPDGTGNMVPNNGFAFMPDIPIELNLSNTYNGSLRIEQPIYTGGKVTAAYKMAQTGHQMAQANVKLSASQVILICDQAYWNCVKAKAMVETTLQVKETLQELQRMVQNGVDEGMVHRKELLTVQVKMNEANLNLARAQNGYTLAIMNLNHITGLPLENTTKVVDSFQEDLSINSTSQPRSSSTQFDTLTSSSSSNSLNHFDTSNSASGSNSLSHFDTSNSASGSKQFYPLNSFDITSRPEYELLTKQVQLKKEQEKLARSEFLPNVGVMGVYGYTNGLKMNGEKLIEGANFAALLSINIPIFHWGEGRNKIKEAKVQSSIAQMQLNNSQQKMTLEATQAINELSEAQLEVALTSKSVEQAQENMSVSRERYSAGMETLANYMEAQTMWQNAMGNYITAKASFNLSKTKYLKATGKL